MDYETVQPILYRSFQFFAAVGSLLQFRYILSPADKRLLQSVLSTPAQQQLFACMSANDQRHALAVARTLQQAGYTDIALLQAALLHDVGKTLGQPIMHRVIIVLLEIFIPNLLQRLSRGPSLASTPPPTSHLSPLTSHFSFLTPFIIHAQHPHIGAAWAEAAACQPLAVCLIARHQDQIEVIFTPEEYLLTLLQWADNLN